MPSSRRQAPRLLYLNAVPRRTRPSDASGAERADDLAEVVQDKRSGWRADPARSRRRNRRYVRRLTEWLADDAGAQTNDHDDSTV